MATVLITILSLVLMVLVLLQTPNQETLGNAFYGDKVYTSPVTKFLKRSTFIIVLLITFIILLTKYNVL